MNTPDMSTRVRRIKKTESMLKRWHGKYARLRELTTSHVTLTILLFDDGVTCNEHNLLISCAGPIYIQSPVLWQNNRLSIRLSTMEDARIAVVDEVANVEIHAISFSVFENVKLR